MKVSFTVYVEDTIVPKAQKHRELGIIFLKTLIGANSSPNEHNVSFIIFKTKNENSY